MPTLMLVPLVTTWAKAGAVENTIAARAKNILVFIGITDTYFFPLCKNKSVGFVPKRINVAYSMAVAAKLESENYSRETGKPKRFSNGA